MTMNDLEKMQAEYTERALNANAEEEEKLSEIVYAIHQALTWGAMVGTDADKAAFGEFTRRFERAKEEVRTLMD